MSSISLKGLEKQGSPPEYGTLLRWVTVFVFVAAEWMILFRPGLWSSFGFFRQAPGAMSCREWSNPEAAFLNLKAWVVVSLAQAIVWGAVTYASIGWLIGLWRTGEAAGRFGRGVIVALRTVAFGLGLLFFLTPAPKWDLGCFAVHIDARGSAVLAYVAVGSAAIVMWVLENRVNNLVVTQSDLKAPFKFLELRRKLQSLLSMSSAVLAFGIVGLITRRAFIELSPKIFFSQPIILEGFEYTILLGLAYAPVHAAFNSVGARIRDVLLPRPSNGDVAAFQEWSRASNKLGDLMQIKLYDWKSFGPGFPILAPFLLGLLSALVKK